ncbi:MAG TPA: DUF2157 domain-containing protein [Burkholderiaceae bacterium]|nr:DUF2157 domain-containing protein [Burkholderiaceae bacterium]HQR71142.1 DUF2157 domain-containing protein [Burkholderiaceae bacterium]
MIDIATLRISRDDLDRAVARGTITGPQAAALWAAWSEQRSAVADSVPRFSVTHVLYYLGGLIAIGAMSLFMNLGWERFGPWALFVIAVAYGIGCIGASHALAARRLMIPAGILATLAIVLVPLATWSLQSALGWWPPGGAGEHYRAYHTHIDWRWITLEFATLVAAVIGLWRLRHPFMVMPLAVTLWYMSMDLARMIVFAERPGWSEWQYYRDFSLVFGLGMLAVAVWVDFRARRSFAVGRDFAFWLYLFGTLTFWGGLTMQQSGSEFGKFVYLLINVALVALGAILGRRVFAVFGGFGIAAYLGYLSHRVFADSLLFPLALTAIGLAIVAAGIWWQRNEARLSAALRRRLPDGWRELLETRHEALGQR